MAFDLSIEHAPTRTVCSLNTHIDAQEGLNQNGFGEYKLEQNPLQPNLLMNSVHWAHIANTSWQWAHHVLHMFLSRFPACRQAGNELWTSSFKGWTVLTARTHYLFIMIKMRQNFDGLILIYYLSILAIESIGIDGFISDTHSNGNPISHTEHITGHWLRIRRESLRETLSPCHSP